MCIYANFAGQSASLYIRFCLPSKLSRERRTVPRMPASSPVASNPILTAQMGQQGGRSTNDTVAVTGNFYAIYCVTDTVFSSITETGWSGSRYLTRKAGTYLYGAFTGYQLTSGNVEAYNA